MKADPTPVVTSGNAEMRQQMELLQAMQTQLNAALKRLDERPATPTGTSGPSYKDMQDLAAKLASLEARLFTDTEGQALKAKVEALDRLANRLQARSDETLNGNAQRDIAVENLKNTLETVKAQLNSQEARIEGWSKTLDAKIADALQKLAHSTSPMAVDPRLQAEVTRLQEELKVAKAEAETAVNKAKAEEDERKKQKKRAEELESENNKLREEVAQLKKELGRKPEVQPVPPSTASQGAVTGRILAITGTASPYNALVVFPANTPYAEKARFNVFNSEGKKIADFTVTKNSTPEGYAGRETWFGGDLVPLRPSDIPRKDDRVSNLVQLPPQ